MKNRRVWFCLLVLGAAAVVASVPAATQTFAASASAKKSAALNDAKQKCTQKAEHAWPGANPDAYHGRRLAYHNCMRRAGALR
jgi:hypothetical protein